MSALTTDEILKPYPSSVRHLMPLSEVAHFDALARADWPGVMALGDADPQEEPLDPGTPVERDWRDLADDATRSLRNATRCEAYSMRRVNLLLAANQIRMALERLR